MFELIPQAVAACGEVPGTSLYEEAILYLALKQKGVEDFILPVFWNLFISSDSIKISIFIVWLFIWSPNIKQTSLKKVLCFIQDVAIIDND